MNFKTFVFMILTFRRVDPIPKNIGLMLSITFWISLDVDKRVYGRQIRVCQGTTAVQGHGAVQ